jgi:CheY-like chemotaxis protein
MLQEVGMSESRNQRILIVDNDEKESNRLEAMLQGAGYDTITTWSGVEALELLKSRKIDILLLSSYLPDMYIGAFLARLGDLPVQPCSIVMQEGHNVNATLRKVQGMIGAEHHKTFSVSGADPHLPHANLREDRNADLWEA